MLATVLGSARIAAVRQGVLGHEEPLLDLRGRLGDEYQPDGAGLLRRLPRTRAAHTQQRVASSHHPACRRWGRGHREHRARDAARDTGASYVAGAVLEFPCDYR